LMLLNGWTIYVYHLPIAWTDFRGIVPDSIASASTTSGEFASGGRKVMLTMSK